jgi:hypothetical protein
MCRFISPAQICSSLTVYWHIPFTILICATWFSVQGCQKIVAESMTITGSIGVVTGEGVRGQARLLYSHEHIRMSIIHMSVIHMRIVHMSIIHMKIVT